MGAMEMGFCAHSYFHARCPRKADSLCTADVRLPDHEQARLYGKLRTDWKAAFPSLKSFAKP